MDLRRREDLVDVVGQRSKKAAARNSPAASEWRRLRGVMCALELAWLFNLATQRVSLAGASDLATKPSIPNLKRLWSSTNTSEYR